MPSATEQVENNSIYIFLNHRGALPDFHWGLYVPRHKPHGEVWHATNESGGWIVEVKKVSELPNALSLCLCFKVGTVAGQQDWDTLCDALAKVPASGGPSVRTGEAFSCRVWVKDALVALRDAGLVRLAEGVEGVEGAAVEAAEANREAVEQGTGGAVVLDGTKVSTTTTTS